MDFSEIILLPVYILIAVIIWRVLRLDAWLKPLIDEYRTPAALEKKVKELEERILKIEMESIRKE
jgi:hypothetical protein